MEYILKLKNCIDSAHELLPSQICKETYKQTLSQFNSLDNIIIVNILYLLPKSREYLCSISSKIRNICDTQPHFPRLIVFDFHGVLSLCQGSGSLGKICINDMKKLLRKHKTGSGKTEWYSLMKTANINPKKLMPTIEDVILFVNYIKFYKKDTVFAIASSVEQDSFMNAVVKYCFEAYQQASPFDEKAVIGTITLMKYPDTKNIKGKQRHISIILSQTGLDIPTREITLIDDSSEKLEIVSEMDICGVLVFTDGGGSYFTIMDWNQNTCGWSKI